VILPIREIRDEVFADLACIVDLGMRSCSVDGGVRGVPPGTTVLISGSETASASYGALQIGQNLSLTPQGSQLTDLKGGFVIVAGASFSDSLTVGGYSGSGFIGITLNPAGSPETWFSVPPERLNVDGQDVDFLGQSVTLLPFTSGVPVSLRVGFELEAEGSPGDAPAPFGSYGVDLNNITLFDTNMDPISGYTLTAASGTDYPATGETPEPGSLCLLGTVLVACAWFTTKRRVASSNVSPNT
jgi:hypothetical protein